MRVLVIDLETENNPYYGSVASPHCPINYIVEYAYRVIEIGKGPVVYNTLESYRYNSLEEFTNNFKGFNFDGVDMIVAHNFSYEASWFMKHDFENFCNFIKRGGRIYCTQLAHYLLSNQTDIYPALNEIAPLYGGTPKVDAVKALWEAGHKTSEIDPALLHEYLCSDHGDIDNTVKVFLGTWEQLRKRKMLTMALIRMDALLFSAFCMFFGMKVDMERAEELKRLNEERLVELEKVVTSLLPDDMPELARQQFKGTRYQLSALIFGGVMKYDAKVPRTDSDGNLIYKKEEGPYFKSIKGALPTSQCVFDEEAGGLWYNEELKEHQARYVSGKNKGLPKFAKYDTDEVDTKNGTLLYEFKPLISDEVYEKLRPEIEGNWAGKQKLADGSPVISTSGDVLEVLAAHDVKGAKELMLIVKIDKDLSSFYEKIEYNKDGSIKKVSGNLQYVDEDGFIHHELNHTSTATGRLSSSKPNMQNQPRADEVKEGDFKSRVKEIFVSRFGTDGGILQMDYSALETVGLQVFSRDSNLKSALLEGKDMHSIRLASMEGLDYDYVVARTKDEHHPDHAEWDVKRTEVKPVAFQYQYGATAYGMAMSTGKSKEFCQAFIDAEKEAFPEVEDWFENTVYKTVYESADTNKPIRMELDDGRYFLVRKGIYQSIEGTCYQFTEQTKEAYNYVTRQRETVKEFRIPQMRNYPIQGGSGFFVQLGCGLLIRHFVSVDFLGMKCLPVNTVHDANYFDCHKDVVYEAAYQVEAIMECIPEVINSIWPEFNCEVPFPVAGGFGKNMAEEHKVYEDTPEAKAEYLKHKADFKKEFLAKRGLEVMF